MLHRYQNTLTLLLLVQSGWREVTATGISGTRHASYAIRFLKTRQCRISLEIQGTQLERNDSNCNPFVCTASLQYYLNRLIQNTTGKKTFARNGKEMLVYNCPNSKFGKSMTFEKSLSF